MTSYIAALLLLAQVVTSAPAYELVVKCLSSSNVPQLYPGTTSFAQSIIPLNLRLNFTPIALATPLNVPQVQAAVRCATKYGVKVNPRSGGHSYASHSIGGEDGHLVVDLKYFNSVKLDTKTNVATVGPGARLGNLAVELYNKGGRAIAHGVCESYFLNLLLSIYLNKSPTNEIRSRVTTNPTLTKPNYKLTLPASALAATSSMAVKATPRTPQV